MGVPQDHHLFMIDVSLIGPLACHVMFLFMTDVSSTGPLVCHVIFLFMTK